MRVAWFLAGLLATATAHAASIEYGSKVDGLNLITITGQIEEGDADKFNQVIAQLPGRSIVALESPGGVLIDGLNLGLAIHRHNFDTAVLPNETCASVCGLMWLAGATRYMADTSKIGFHEAAFGDGSIAGQGNALIGAYLHEMGLKFDTVAYLTRSTPGEMTWLRPTEANRFGIAYSLFQTNTAQQQPPVQPQYSPPRTVAAEQSSWTAAYAQGRQARIDYEQWFNTLPEGLYKTGVLYWAAHRSDKPHPPNCDGPTDWQSGCLAARTKLTPSDVRRHTEPDFWYGWNSL